MDEGRKRDPKMSVPEIAHIGGVIVGLNSMEYLEERLGQGRPFTGGHSNGGRAWRLIRPRASLRTDGFDSFDRNGHSYAGGRQLALFHLTDGVSNPRLPLARAHACHFRFLGKVGLGASYAEALRLLKRVHPPTKIEPESLTWEADGFVRVSRVNHYTTTSWTACLSFDRKRLVSIQILCG